MCNRTISRIVNELRYGLCGMGGLQSPQLRRISPLTRWTSRTECITTTECITITCDTTTQKLTSYWY